MSKFMLGLVLISALAACNNDKTGTKNSTGTVTTKSNDPGQSVKIDGTKNTVIYYKDGITEAEAKKAGEVFKRMDKYFVGSELDGPMQLTQSGDVVTLHMVYDKKMFDTIPNKDVFAIYGPNLSYHVFHGRLVNVALSDKDFSDYKTIPYNDGYEMLLEDDLFTAGFDKSVFKHERKGDVDFYWFRIPDRDAKRISEYIFNNGAFSGGTSELYITKDDKGYIIHYPVKAEYREDQSLLNEVERVARQIKENVFPNDNFEFRVTDENLKRVKKWNF